MVSQDLIRESRICQKQLDENPAAFIERHTIAGHADSSHLHASRETLLNNVLSGQKTGDTAFTDRDTQIECMTEILYANMYKICELVESGRDGDVLKIGTAFTDQDTDEPAFIGHGFLSSVSKDNMLQKKCRIDAIRTNAAAIIVKKNRNAMNGWEIVSAFPESYPDKDTLDACVEPTGEDFSDLLHRIPAYRKATPMQRVYMDYACSGRAPVHDGISVEYQSPKTSTQQERIIVSQSKGPAVAIYGDENALVRIKQLNPPHGRKDEYRQSDQMREITKKFENDIARAIKTPDSIRNNRLGQLEPMTRTIEARRQSIEHPYPN